MQRVTLVKNTVPYILKQLAWRGNPTPKGGSDPQLTVSPSLEYKSKSNNILLTYFRKFTFYWPDVNCHHVFYRPYGHDLSSSAMGQNYQTPITLLPRFKKEREKLCQPYHRRWLQVPEEEKVIYCSLTFTAWKSFTLTAIQTCLVQANCFHFLLVSYISCDSNLTLRKIKKK